MARTLLTVALTAAAALCAGAVEAATLTTTLTTDNNGRSGLYFDLTNLSATNAIVIDSFVVNGTGAAPWDIYYKAGTYAGSETDAAAWTLLGSASTAGAGLEPLSVGGLTIGSGMTFGLYAWNASTDPAIYAEYNDGIATYSDGTLSFSGGTSNYGSFLGLSAFNNTLDDRTFSGSILYSIAAVPEPSTWAMMVVGLGLVGYAARRRRVAIRFG